MKKITCIGLSALTIMSMSTAVFAGQPSGMLTKDYETYQKMISDESEDTLHFEDSHGDYDLVKGDAVTIDKEALFESVSEAYEATDGHRMSIFVDMSLGSSVADADGNEAENEFAVRMNSEKEETDDASHEVNDLYMNLFGFETNTTEEKYGYFDSDNQYVIVSKTSDGENEGEWMASIENDEDESEPMFLSLAVDDSEGVTLLDNLYADEDGHEYYVCQIDLSTFLNEIDELGDMEDLLSEIDSEDVEPLTLLVDAETFIPAALYFNVEGVDADVDGSVFGGDESMELIFGKIQMEFHMEPLDEAVEIPSEIIEIGGQIND